MPSPAVENSITEIDIGEGDFVDLSVAQDGRWLFDFVPGPSRRAPQPSAKDVKVEAISAEGHVVPLMVRDSADCWIEATGRTAAAAYLRISVPHESHMHVRSVPISSGPVPLNRQGPNGGSVADIGHGSLVEVVAVDAGRLELNFLRENGGTEAAPPAGAVKVELIARGGMVRPLLVINGGKQSGLAATGQLAGVERVRVIIQHAGHAQDYEVSLAGAT